MAVAQLREERLAPHTLSEAVDDLGEAFALFYGQEYDFNGLYVSRLSENPQRVAGSLREMAEQVWGSQREDEVVRGED